MVKLFERQLDVQFLLKSTWAKRHALAIFVGPPGPPADDAVASKTEVFFEQLQKCEKKH